MQTLGQTYPVVLAFWSVSIQLVLGSASEDRNFVMWVCDISMVYETGFEPAPTIVGMG